MYDDILVPVDASEASEAAVDHAVELADRFDATLHGLYVVDVAEEVTAAGAGGIAPQVEEALEAEGERALDTVRREADEAGVELQTALQRGVPHEKILGYADHFDCDLVVMGTHGRSGIERHLLGSVAERTVRTATVPVMTVHPAEE